MQRAAGAGREVLRQLRPGGRIEPADAPRPPRARSLLLAAVLVSLAGAAAVHGPRVVQNLPRAHWEDFRFFRHTRAEVPSLPSCLAAPSMWPGLYRPLSTGCYYHLGRRLFDNRLEAYHVLNGALFVVNGALLALVASSVLPGRWPLLATLLFVTRRAHGQVALYTSEAQALLSTLFALLAVMWAVRDDGRRARAASALLLLAALLSKETVLVAPAIVMAYRRLVDPRRRWAIPWAMVAAVAAYGALLAAARSRAPGTSTGFAWDASAALLPRLAAHALDFSNALTAGTPHVAMPEAVLRWAWSPAGPALAAMLVATLAAALAAPGELPAPARAAAFGIAWWAAGAAPFLFFADRLFMRYSYFAHAGLAIAVAALAAWAWSAARAARRPASPASAAPATP